MTARSAAAVSSLVLLCGLAVAGCTSFYEIPIETPIQPKMDVSGFQRVLVAGFVSGGSDDVDANTETVRLLRSQLRTKSQLRVIEADALPLAEVAADQAKANGTAPAENAALAPVPSLPPAGVPAADVPTTSTTPSAPATTRTADTPAKPADPKKPESSIKSEKDLAKYDKIFADAAYWKKLGEEYQNPLIVTGTVMFVPLQSSGFVQSENETYDTFGRRSVSPVRTFKTRKGFSLQPRFVFIDGKTGAVLYSETFHEETLYDEQQNVPALSTYFELMDRIVPSFLSTLSAQKIKGTRTLLK